MRCVSRRPLRCRCRRRDSIVWGLSNVPGSLGKRAIRQDKKGRARRGPFLKFGFHKDRCARVEICDKIGWAGICDLLACVRTSGWANTSFSLRQWLKYWIAPRSAGLGFRNLGRSRGTVAPRHRGVDSQKPLGGLSLQAPTRAGGLQPPSKAPSRVGGWWLGAGSHEALN